MKKVQLIVRESYQGKRQPEDIFASMFLSNSILTGNRKLHTTNEVDPSSQLLCSKTGAAIWNQ